MLLKQRPCIKTVLELEQKEQVEQLFPQSVGLVSVFFICTSILTFCLKTHPDMRVPIIHNLTVKVAHSNITYQTTLWDNKS